MSVTIGLLDKFTDGVYKDGMRTPQKKFLNRLARISGQINGISRMIEEEKYCVDIITQIQAARAALHSLELKILERHLRHCVTQAFQSGNPNDADQKIEELLKVMKKKY